MAIDQRIVIAGCGPGARECLTGEAMLAIEDAEVLIGAQRLLDLFPQLGARKITIRGYRNEVLQALKSCEGRRVALLVTGDPGLASVASVIVEEFGVGSCRVIPGISSVQVAFARLGMPWEGARIVSAHAAVPELDVDGLAMERKIAVLSGDSKTIGWISSLAKALGREWKIIVAQDLTLRSEKVFEVAAEELDELPQPLRAVIVFHREGSEEK